MISSTITVRIDEAKKHRGNAILKKHGMTPSQCVNKLYDLMIESGDLIWRDSKESVFSMPQDRIKEAQAFVASIPMKSRFSTMSDKEIKVERLKLRGLID